MGLSSRWLWYRKVTNCRTFTESSPFFSPRLQPIRHEQNSLTPTEANLAFPSTHRMRVDPLNKLVILGEGPAGARVAPSTQHLQVHLWTPGVQAVPTSPARGVHSGAPRREHVCSVRWQQAATVLAREGRRSKVEHAACLRGKSNLRPGGQKLGMKVSRGLVSAEASFLGLQMAVFILRLHVVLSLYLFLHF